MSNGRPARLRRSSRVRGLTALILLAAPATAQDQRDLTSLSLEELSQMKVTAVSKTEGPRFLTPAAVHVITADDIRRSGAPNVPEALRLAPGIQVARINSSQWAIGVRGFTDRLARSQLALMDGRSLYTPLFAGTYWEVQDTMLEDVERIEVVRGPGGTLWGANAVNGIVNIITKDAKDTQGWLVAAGGGTEERAFVRARYGGRISDRGHYRVYGKYFRRDAAFHEMTGDFDDWRKGQAGFRTDWTLHGEDLLTVQGDVYSGSAGQRTNATFYEPPFLRTIESDGEFSGGNLTARWNHLLKGSQFTVYTYYDRTRRAEATFREVRDTFDIDVQDHFTLAKKHDIVAGLGYRLSSGRSQGIETVAFDPPDRTDYIFSAFLHDETSLIKDRLRVSLGTKLERNRYTGFELQPSGRLLWSPRPRHAVWAAITRAVRTPSRVETELDLTVSLSPNAPLFGRVVGDAGFKSETVVAYEAGYRLRPVDRLSLELALFHNRYDDLLNFETAPAFREDGRQVVPFRAANTLRGHGTGLELASVVQVSARWVVRGEYSYLKLDLETKPGSTTTTPPSAEGTSPRHAVHLQSSWSLPGRIDLDANFRWVDKLRTTMVPAYSTLDARVGWRAFPELEVAVVGQSLLQAHHPEFGAAATRSEIQRSVYFEATWRR